jgi:hypothetical protein
MGDSESNRRKMPWWMRLLVAAASIGLPRPVARELREHMEHPPEPYRGLPDPAGLWAIRIYAVVFTLIVIAVVVLFVVLSLTR